MGEGLVNTKIIIQVLCYSILFYSALKVFFSEYALGICFCMHTSDHQHHLLPKLKYKTASHCLNTKMLVLQCSFAWYEDIIVILLQWALVLFAPNCTLSSTREKKSGRANKSERRIGMITNKRRTVL